MRDDFKLANIKLTYQIEPQQNISLARNLSLNYASGSYVAFIDDDEIASETWLAELFSTMELTNSDGVWGPVIPIIPNSFPNWMRKSSMFLRPNPEDLSTMQNICLRTGNMLIKKHLIETREGPFDKALGKTGGGDSELLTWIKLNYKETKFTWAANAIVYEHIEEKRRYIRWHLIRAYRGGWGHSKQLAQRYGFLLSLILSVLKLFPSLSKAVWNALTHCKNFKFASLILLQCVISNIGKLGYFFGAKIEEYKS